MNKYIISVFIALISLSISFFYAYSTTKDILISIVFAYGFSIILRIVINSFNKNF